jgi:ribonuclease D
MSIIDDECKKIDERLEKEIEEINKSFNLLDKFTLLCKKEFGENTIVTYKQKENKQWVGEKHSEALRQLLADWSEA